ncbi:MAG: hypothetical protein KBI47_20020 [Armatimonadetes bacterium]|nr:hypothetical protein [Armatimonadota bacterium]MDI9585200.1 hypothetical protein [Acidobacteriota bacterium]
MNPPTALHLVALVCICGVAASGALSLAGFRVELPGAGPVAEGFRAALREPGVSPTQATRAT